MKIRNIPLSIGCGFPAGADPQVGFDNVDFWHHRLIPIQAPPSLGVKMAKSVQSRSISTELNLEQFRQFVLPYLTV